MEQVIRAAPSDPGLRDGLRGPDTKETAATQAQRSLETEMAASDLRSSALEQTPSQRSSTSDVVTPHHPTAPHMGAASKPESRPAESKNLGDTLTSAQNPAIAEKQATLQQVKAELVEANATVARLKDRIARLTDQIAGQTGLSQRKTTSENTNSNGPTAMQQTQQQDASQPTDQATTTSRHDHPHTSALDEYYIGNGRSDDDVIDSDDSERNDSFDKERPRSRSQVATFHSLLEKRKNLPTRIEIEDRLDWIEHVRSVLEDEDVVEDFFKWMRAEIDSKAPYEKVTMAKFKSSLKEADWEKLNPASRIVTSKLCELYIDRDPQLYLGISKGFQTALRLNSRALILRDADLSICDFHNIEIVNPPPLLAMRYIPLDSSGEKQSLLFITLGKSIGPI